MAAGDAELPLFHSSTQQLTAFDTDPPQNRRLSTSASTASKRMRAAIPSSSEGGRTPSAKSTYPSGLRPWLSLIWCFFLMWNSAGILSSHGSFASHLSQSMFAQTPRYLVHLIGSTQLFLAFALSIFIGRFLDANKSHHVVRIGLFFMTVGSLMLPLQKFGEWGWKGNLAYSWTALGLFTGIGVACFFMSALQIITTWFENRKNIAIAVVWCGASIGGLTYRVGITYMLEHTDYQTTTSTYFVFVLLTSAVPAILCRAQSGYIGRPFKKGVLAWSEFVDRAAFNNSAFIVFAIGVFFLYFGYYAIFFNLDSWQSEYLRYTDSTRISLTLSFYLPAILGYLASGCVAEWASCLALPAHASAAAIASAAILNQWHSIRDASDAIAFFCLCGFCVGSVVGLIPACVAQILDAKSIEHATKLGQWTGTVYALASFAAFAGPLLGDALRGPWKIQHGAAEYSVTGAALNLSHANGWLRVRMFSGVCFGVATGFLVLASFLASSRGTGISLSWKRFRAKLLSFGWRPREILTYDQGGDADFEKRWEDEVPVVRVPPPVYFHYHMGGP